MCPPLCVLRSNIKSTDFDNLHIATLIIWPFYHKDFFNCVGYETTIKYIELINKALFSKCKPE